MEKTTTKKELSLIPLYEKFIRDSKTGKRLQPNGKKLTAGTITNYHYALKLLKAFSLKKEFPLRIRPVHHLNRRELEREKNYWKKFYKQFSAYLYNDCSYYDNYAGQCFKNLKVFFNYLNKELALMVGDFHKQFYVQKEQIAIFPLMPEELNFLIYDKDFENKLSPRMREVKDFFVFGCTVALRISDLLALQKTSIRVINGFYYLSVRSVKTATDTLVKLPPYAIDIVLKYRKQKKKLLPPFNISNLNKYIKLLLEQAGFMHAVTISRDRRGKSITKKKASNAKILFYRFCDIASTHTMRRTAITTMLCLGMQEQVVRKISGHAPHTKEFYRYVLWAQTYQDEEVQKVFEKLKEKKLKIG